MCERDAPRRHRSARFHIWTGSTRALLEHGLWRRGSCEKGGKDEQDETTNKLLFSPPANPQPELLTQLGGRRVRPSVRLLFGCEKPPSTKSTRGGRKGEKYDALPGAAAAVVVVVGLLPVVAAATRTQLIA